MIKHPFLPALAAIALALASQPHLAAAPEQPPSAAGADKGDKKADAPFQGTKWRLTHLKGVKVEKPAPKAEDYFLQLDGKGRFSAFAGCNRMGGGYELKAEGQVKFGQMMSTMMACDNMETEQAFAKVLEGAGSYRITGRTMTLHAGPAAGEAKDALAAFEAIGQ